MDALGLPTETVRVLIELAGGPFDGLSRPMNEPPQLVWAASDSIGRVRLYRHAAPGRLPYQADGSNRGAVRATYLYGGHRHFVCAGCGTYHAAEDGDGNKVVRCHLCGHPAPSAFGSRCGLTVAHVAR